MSRTEDKYIVALDIGTSKVCALVGEINDRGLVEIIGKGTSPMKGTRRGNIINLDQAIDAVKKAVDEAEVMAGLQIESVYVGVAGDHIRSVNSRGVVSVSGKHKEIVRDDIDRVIEASKSINIPAELELLHVIPREFIVDGQDGIHDPLGMTDSVPGQDIVDRPVGDVEVEAVILSKIIVRAGPAVITLNDASQVEHLFLLVAGDAVSLQDRLDQANIIERIRPIDIALDLRRRTLQGQRLSRRLVRSAVFSLVAA